MSTVDKPVIERISVSDDRFPAFLRWLVEQGLDELRDLIYVVEKPSHYQVEWNEFLDKIETEQKR